MSANNSGIVLTCSAAFAAAAPVATVISGTMQTSPTVTAVTAVVPDAVIFNVAPDPDPEVVVANPFCAPVVIAVVFFTILDNSAFAVVTNGPPVPAPN